MKNIRIYLALIDWLSLGFIVVAGFAGAPWWIVLLAIAWWLKLESGQIHL